jgi:ribose transport system substrate-binding protein
MRRYRGVVTAALVAISGGIALPCAAGPMQDTAHAVDPTNGIVASATAHGVPWMGPVTGPAAHASADIAVVVEDLRNGGALGVAQGVQEAAGVIGWRTRVLDSGGTPAGRSNAISAAIARHPDGIVLVGVDAQALHPLLKPLADARIPVVGWHVAADAGVMRNGAVAENVSTDPLAVARVTALAAVAASGGRANVVIFTDSSFEIARAKADAMAQVIRACNGCRLLEVRNLPISACPSQMQSVTRDLLARYGRQWTYALAINDIYFDYAAPELTRAERGSHSISMLSAGDGSAAAFLRIEAGTFQTGTVAEPLNMQGWQLIDDLNRLFAHQPVSGFIAPVHLVTPDNVAFDGGRAGKYDPDVGYRDIYRRIWKR